MASKRRRRAQRGVAERVALSQLHPVPHHGMDADPRKLIEAFWSDLYAHDFDKVGSYFADDGLYEDVPAPDAGAVGPAAVAARLRIGLEPIDRSVHHLHRMIVEGQTVVTEHTEEWHFPTGEVVSLPFVSIHVLEGGKIKLWRDYWDFQTLMSGAPAWWIEHLARHTEADFGGG